MRSGTLSALAAAALAAASASAAPGGKEPVADGFVDWANVSDANLLAGLSLTPSDLRQRTVVYVVVDDAWLTRDNLCKLRSVIGYMPNPPEGFSWDVGELDFRKVAVVSVRNCKDAPSKFAERLKTSKDMDAKAKDAISSIRGYQLPFYRDVAPAGGPDVAADRLPYVAVYAADSAEPVFKAEKFGFESGVLYKAVADASKRLPADWTWPLGVREPKHFKALPAMVAKGRTAKELQAAVKAGVKSGDPEVAKEAQTIYDAVAQYGTMLRLRILREYRTAPARACYDATTLVRMFPEEKKKIAAVDAKLKKLPEAGSLGKVVEKLMLWSRDDFAPKSKGEAKKIVADLQKMKKALAALAESKNTQVQGEAMLFANQLDALIDLIPAKAPQQ